MYLGHPRYLILTRFRFQWVNLQIQNLCDFQRIKIEEDLKDELGKLPTALAELYSIIYGRISSSAKPSYAVAMRALGWLLYAQRSLHASEFLQAVSVESEKAVRPISKMDLLDICANFVVLDSELDVFRFAHLSVREYLESKSEFLPCKVHSSMARQCLRVLFNNLSFTSQDRFLAEIDTFYDYAYLHWPIHCYLADPSTWDQALKTQVHRFLWLNNAVGTLFSRWVSFISYRKASTVNGVWRDRLKQCLSDPPHPLLVACSFGFLSVVDQLSASTLVDLNFGNQYGETGPLLACQYGHTSIVKVLKEHGADFNKATRRGPMGIMKTPFSAAISSGCAALVILLLEGKSSFEPNDCPNTCLLHLAALTGNRDLVQILLVQGAKADVICSHHSTPLCTAAARGDIPTAQLLLENGANPSLQSPLQSAARQGHRDMVRLLLQKDQSGLNRSESYYGPPLHCAAWDGREDVMDCLLDAGADINSTGGPYEHILQTLSVKGGDSIIRKMIERGADVDAHGGYWGNALCAAIHYNNETAVRILLENGADINKWGLVYGNAIHFAAFHGQLIFLKMIAPTEDQINEVSGPFGTAIQAALRGDRSSDEMINWLLDQGATLEVPSGVCLLHWAAHFQQPTTVQLLLRRGAKVDCLCDTFGCVLQAAATRPEGLLRFHNRDRALRVMELLIDAGASPNVPGGKFGNALQAAAFAGDLVVAKRLLTAGAKFVTGVGVHDNPLRSASAQGHFDIVEHLLSDPQLEIDHGLIGLAMQAAACRGRTRATELFLLEDRSGIKGEWMRYKNYLLNIPYRRYDETFATILDFALEQGFPNHLFDDVLQAGVYSGNEKAVELLLSNRANVNACGGYYGSALQAAACNEHDGVWISNRSHWLGEDTETMFPKSEILPDPGNSIVRYLLTCGADANSTGGIFGSPLQAAAFGGNPFIVEELLQSGANIKRGVGYFSNPLEAAASSARAVADDDPAGLHTSVRVNRQRILNLLLDNTPMCDQHRLCSEALKGARLRKDKAGIRTLRNLIRDRGSKPQKRQDELGSYGDAGDTASGFGHETDRNGDDQ